MNIKFDINKSIKENGIFKTVVYFLILVIVFIVPVYFFYSGKVSNLEQQLSASMSQNVVVDNNFDKKSSEISIEEYKGGDFDKMLDYWEIDFKNHWKKKDENGFYCPESDDYPFPKIWYKDLIPSEFKSIEIRYILKYEKNNSNNSNQAPTFVFAIGKDKEEEILRLFIPEEDSWLVGSQKRIKKDTMFYLERESPKRKLDEPIQHGEVVVFVINRIASKLDEFTFDVNLNYKSSRTGEPIPPKTLRYDNVVSFDSDLNNEFSGIDVGFGTKNGYCIKPLSYKIIID